MADYLQDNPVHGEVLVPVPLHSRRLRERGYNQSNLLAQELGKLIDIPVIDGSLRRIKDSLPQARTTTIDERRENVKEAFTCQGEELKEKHVILIDDVCTSGATLEACAVALKAGGAISVWGFTLAREI
jgi:ComF family protein